MFKIRPDFSISLVAGLLCCAWLLSGQTRAASSPSEHWVTTWATAESLTNAPLGGRGGGRGPAPGGGRGNGPGSVNGAAPGEAPALNATPPQAARRRPNDSGMPPTFNDQTVRMVARVSLGGRKIRVRLS